MPSPYEDLIDAITRTAGISRTEAEVAARRCSMAIMKKGLVGYTAASGYAYFMAMNPAAAFGVVATAAAAGAAYAFATAPQCGREEGDLVLEHGSARIDESARSQDSSYSSVWSRLLFTSSPLSFFLPSETLLRLAQLWHLCACRGLCLLTLPIQRLRS